jgi:uncharacterized membrane protein YfcA
MIALTVALAVLVGITLGLLGGGGSILTVPLLAYVAGMDAKEAIATSLLVVGVTSAVGAISHARAGRVQWRTGILFGLTGMVGAYAGGLLSRFIPGSVLLLGFAAMMIATAVAMLRGRRTKSTAQDGVTSMPIAKILLDGAIVGLVTGLVGAGGGFLVVPALALLGGLPMPVAVGTSLIVIAMKSFAGLGGYLSTVQIDWRLATMVTGAAVVGSLLGGRLTSLIDPDTLRKGFGWFVLIMSSVILAQEIHPSIGIAAAGLTLAAAGATYACTRSTHCPLQRLGSREPASAAAG